MKKLDGRTLDIEAENIARLKELFPAAVEEGRIDFAMLRQLLGDYVDDAQERYSFNWNGKGRALHLAQTPSTGTLRPVREDSLDWDTTGNLYIEGDNLEVLKLLQKSYHDRIKMIYIDPPYNTGNDFIYHDDYRDSLANYKRMTGQTDEEGYPLRANTEASGRFHTDWLNMMYPRLMLARNLLAQDGVIFISIDDMEFEKVKMLCNEVFGEHNFVTTIHCQMSTTQGMKVKAAKDGNIVKNGEYILCYSRNGKKNIARQPLYDLRPEYDEHYSLILREDGTIGQLKELYDYTYPNDLNNEKPLRLAQAFKKSEEFAEIVRTHLAEIVCTDKVTSNSDKILEQGKWVKDVINDKEYLLTLDSKGNMKQLLRLSDSWGATDDFYGTNGLRKIRGDWWDGFYVDMGNVSKEGDIKFKNGKKPLRLISQLVKMVTGYDGTSNDIILDFFSGSATTAHSIMKLNAEDGGHRKFILVQLPEVTEEKSDERSEGFLNICDLGKARIKKAGINISANNENVDTGFKVFSLDSSNLKEWNPDVDNIELALEESVDNLLPGRTEADLVYEIMLKLGLDLTYPIEQYELASSTIYVVGAGALMIALGAGITVELADELVRLHAEYESEVWQVVLRDGGFATESDKANTIETLHCAGLADDSIICV